MFLLAHIEPIRKSESVLITWSHDTVHVKNWFVAVDTAIVKRELPFVTSTLGADALLIVWLCVNVLATSVFAVSASYACTLVPISLFSKTVTHSTAITHALTLLNVVSVACHNSIAVNCGLSLVASHIIDLASQPTNASISHVPAELLHSILLVAMCCILAKVTTSSSIVQVVPLQETVISHLSQSDTHPQKLESMYALEYVVSELD